MNAIVRQPDGKIIIAGSFTNVLGSARSYIARLMPDLTLDTGFNSGSGPNNSITQVELGTNGRIYIFGSFSSIGGSLRNAIARLNADGSLDTSFNTGVDWTFSNGIRAQPDGKLIVYGDFGTLFDAPAKYIARLNLDGSLDTSFYCNISGRCDALSLQPDGRMVMAGWFDTINGASHPYFARVKTDGGADSSFTGTASLATISGLNSMGNGSDYANGSFTTISGVSRK